MKERIEKPVSGIGSGNNNPRGGLATAPPIINLEGYYVD